jgi:hypothetical protein
MLPVHHRRLPPRRYQQVFLEGKFEQSPQIWYFPLGQVRANRLRVRTLYLPDCATQHGLSGNKMRANAVSSQGTHFEAHFTPQDLAELWKLDDSTIRRMFIDEPGVLKFGKQARRDGKREYVTLRIPASVAQRVYERRTR